MKYDKMQIAYDRFCDKYLDTGVETKYFAHENEAIAFKTFLLQHEPVNWVRHAMEDNWHVVIAKWEKM